MQEELKPCPRCGCKAKIYKAFGLYQVGCTNSFCPCMTRLRETETEATDAWNRRAMNEARPDASVELDYGNDGRDCRYYIAYKCPKCGKSTYEGVVACDRCGTFFDWSKKASIKVIRKVEWE